MMQFEIPSMNNKVPNHLRVKDERTRLERSSIRFLDELVLFFPINFPKLRKYSCLATVR